MAPLAPFVLALQGLVHRPIRVVGVNSLDELAILLRVGSSLA